MLLVRKKWGIASLYANVSLTGITKTPNSKLKSVMVKVQLDKVHLIAKLVLGNPCPIVMSIWRVACNREEPFEFSHL